MSRGPESKLTRKILDALKAEGGTWFKVPGTALSKRGKADILGCRLGRFTAIEVKHPHTGHPLSAAQAVFLWRVHRQGGLAGVAYDLEEALDIANERAAGARFGKTNMSFRDFVGRLPISEKEKKAILEAWDEGMSEEG